MAIDISESRIMFLTDAAAWKMLSYESRCEDVVVLQSWCEDAVVPRSRCEDMTVLRSCREDASVSRSRQKNAVNRRFQINLECRYTLHVN